MELVTGIGLTLLGSGLPAIAAFWHLNDAQAGRLLLAVFAGSSLGAMLVRAPFHRNLAFALTLTAVSMAALAAGQGRGLLFLFLLFGTGLGLAMTANTILTGDRYPERRAAMLTLLNFSWSVGAALSPFAVRAVIHRTGVPGLFWSMAAIAAAGTLLALLLLESPRAERLNRSAGRAAAPLRVVIFFALLGLLYCGTEAAFGGWLLTYVHRLRFHATLAAPLAASLFWLSLLAGRAISPAILLRVREDRLLLLALLAAAAGVALVLALHSLPVVLFGAALAGVAMAPIFPIYSSLFMALVPDPAQTRWMFAVAGLGSASFPWITGLLSAHTSLHFGLLVPLCGLLVMLGMMRWPGGGVDLFRAVGQGAETELQSAR